MGEQILSAFVQAGGYAMLAAGLMYVQYRETESHRDEVRELSTVVRENTAAVRELCAAVQGSKEHDE